MSLNDVELFQIRNCIGSDKGLMGCGFRRLSRMQQCTLPNGHAGPCRWNALERRFGGAWLSRGD